MSLIELSIVFTTLSVSLHQWNQSLPLMWIQRNFQPWGNIKLSYVIIMRKIQTDTTDYLTIRNLFIDVFVFSQETGLVKNIHISAFALNCNSPNSWRVTQCCWIDADLFKGSEMCCCLTDLCPSIKGQRSVAVFVRSSMWHIKLTERINNYQTTLLCHWWTAKGKEDQRANGPVRKRVIALKSSHVAAAQSFCRGSVLTRPTLLWALYSSVWPHILARMATLKEVCSGLPLDPLPPNQGRDPSVPHAPTRTPNLTAVEERVSELFLLPISHIHL